MIAASGCIGAGLRRPDAFTKLHLRMNGEGNVFTDLTGKTVTANGNVIQSSALTHFIGRTAYFDGSGDYLSASYNADLEPAGGDFTYEFWFNVPNVTGGKAIFAFNTDFHIGIFVNGSRINYFASSNGSSWNLICGDVAPLNGAGSNTVTAGVWHHVAYCRSGNNWYGFLDGNLDLSITVAGTVVSRSEVFNIGRWGNSNFYQFGGNISEFRLTIGLARYTASFIPPTRRK